MNDAPTPGEAAASIAFNADPRGQLDLDRDRIVSKEKLAELLALRAAYPSLTMTETIDLWTTGGMVERAEEVAAMRVRGGHTSAAAAATLG